MGSLGMPEILMILVIALIIFGPRKLPELGKSLGQSLAQFRRASEDFKRQWEDEVALERQRIAPPPPEPVEYEDYSASSASAEVEESTASSIENATASSSTEEATATSTEEAPAEIPTVSETPLTPHQDENATNETKRDWV